MNWRLVAGVLVALVGVAVAALLIVPGRVEGRLNVVLAHPPYVVPEAAAALHARLQLADLHADTLMWQRDFLQRSVRGHVDLPRLQQGNVALQVLTTVTRSPRGLNYQRNEADAPDDITALALVQRWPPRSWGSLTERALYQAARLDRFAERSGGALLRVRTREDLVGLLARRAAGERVVGAVLGTEGSHALDGQIENIARLHAAGFRIMGLQHFFDNALGGSLHGTSGAGLSEFGRAAVAEMRRLGVIVDLAHSSTAVVEEVLALDARPVIISHTGIRSLCPGPRNIPDELLRRIADRGGIIGIGFWKDAICDDTPAGIARTLAASVELLGADAVALGSDYDGGTTVRLDASELAALTAALLAQGMDEPTIAKVMGGNVLRFLAEHLPGSVAPAG
jgi:microsomal dipeptidase-like Zn-dependent dipeptidase